MKNTSKAKLRLSSNVIELFLPQRRPFLMVDFVDSFSDEPSPTLEAGRHISANEIYFAGHFPGYHLWPGTLTIEGMGQTSALLIAVLTVRRVAQAEGMDPDAALGQLLNLELGYRMHPGFRPDDAADFLRRLRPHTDWLAVGAAVDVKLLRPVFAGQRLDYRAVLAGEHGDMMRFQVEASVEGITVAEGKMTGARMKRPPRVEGAR
jgi:3-hydroxyacyl-[acyl-carrier-protein] dehydratase